MKLVVTRQLGGSPCFPRRGSGCVCLSQAASVFAPNGLRLRMTWGVISGASQPSTTPPMESEVGLFLLPRLVPSYVKVSQ